MNNIKTFDNFHKINIFKYIERNDVESVKNYIDSSHDLNIKNRGSDTILIYSIRYNTIGIIELLLNAGVDINKQNGDGDTALILASCYDNIEIVKLLLKYGANVNEQNNNGDSALIYAASLNKIEIVKLLLDADVADINKQNEYGYTVLVWAAYKNNREIVEILLDHGADEFILNNRNKSFYDCLNDENKEYFTQKYPTSVYNAISNWYEKSFTEFVKEFNIKIKK